MKRSSERKDIQRKMKMKSKKIFRQIDIVNATRLSENVSLNMLNSRTQITTPPRRLLKHGDRSLVHRTPVCTLFDDPFLVDTN